MSLLVCGHRKQADKFSSAKSMGEFTLAASLIIDDVKDLYDTVTKGQDAVKYYWALVIVIAISLILQLLAMIFAMILYFSRYPKHIQNEAPPPVVEMVNQGGDEHSTTGSANHLEVRFEGDDHLADPIPPLALKRLNDGLTVMTVLFAVIHVLKNGLQTEIVETVLPE